ncbi:MAG: serine acetyltransferase [Anaerolineae bacterium]|nr:serine acetyltransferase [Anaerolineae bacterium]
MSRPSTSNKRKTALELFRQDTQRWIRPEEVAHPSEVTLVKTLNLLVRHPSLQAMLIFRLGSWGRSKGLPFFTITSQQIIYFLYGLEMSPGADIDGGLYIAHPNGTVISVQRIGENCSIIANVTLGLRNVYAFPTIGNNVFIGAGARVLGGVHVGDNARIGANAVVIKDIPAGATAVGVPAKIIKTCAETHPAP